MPISPELLEEYKRRLNEAEETIERLKVTVQMLITAGEEWKRRALAAEAELEKNDA